MNRDRLYLTHILECIERIETYIVGGHTAFMESTLIQDAVTRNLQTLCESTQRLSSTLKKANPELDWVGMTLVRNVVTHEYLGLEMKAVWEIVTTDLPKLKAPFGRALSEIENS